MVRQIAPFGVRLPPELKQWLGIQAQVNHRSLNSELIKRLEESRQRETREASAEKR